ncbi:hypothetical protein B0H19DRAFT_1243045 [Mycena capillaripes]|nr:hypothetical protein B0H19DRAFT_1243045 [Mycena capillaripes]
MERNKQQVLQPVRRALRPRQGAIENEINQRKKVKERSESLCIRSRGAQFATVWEAKIVHRYESKLCTSHYLLENHHRTRKERYRPKKREKKQRSQKKESLQDTDLMLILSRYEGKLQRRDGNGREFGTGGERAIAIENGTNRHPYGCSSKVQVSDVVVFAGVQTPMLSAKA